MYHLVLSLRDWEHVSSHYELSVGVPSSLTLSYNELFTNRCRALQWELGTCDRDSITNIFVMAIMSRGITHTPCHPLIRQGPHWLSGWVYLAWDWGAPSWWERSFRWRYWDFISIWIMKGVSPFDPLKIAVIITLSVPNFQTKCIFVIFDEVTNVKIKPVWGSCLHLRHQFWMKIRAVCTGVGSVYDH